MALKSNFFRLVLTLFAFPLTLSIAHGQSAPFDLAGPKVDVRVERSGKTLPISAVPNLLAGDRLWIHPDLPDNQSARYLLIVAFLRGATNPPPENWFTRAETWNRKIHDEGIFVVVPQDATQALIFLAPETGGDFTTLRNAVRARPGAFVRAAQDLNAASLDRMRLETFLDAIHQTAAQDPDDLEEHTKLLARSLAIKVDATCFDRPSNEQAVCLTAHSDQMVLADGHTQTMASAITSGASADLMNQLSYSTAAGAGSFSPYVGAIIDIVRILDNLHTAEYQYIPALSLPKKDTLNLKLNNPPSFKNPKSVIVIGLPPIGPAQFPPLRAVSSKTVYCLEKPELTLNVEGAPLVFATDYAHDLAVHISSKDGKETVVPVTADPRSGGFVLDSKALSDSKLDLETTGHVQGMWGFQSFDGPSFHLASAQPQQWHIPQSDESALITGRKDILHLKSGSSACVSNVSVKSENGSTIAAAWKITAPDELQVEPALDTAEAGKITVAVRQFGLSASDDLHMQAYAEAATLSGFTLYTGDSQGVLRGTRLDQVDRLELNGVRFTPGALTRADNQDELRMSLAPPATKAAFQAQQQLPAKVWLKDGRILPLSVTIAQSRPQVALLSKSIQPNTTAQPSFPPASVPIPGSSPNSPAAPTPNSPQLQIHLSGADELPLNAKLSFSLKSVAPERFPRSETIVVATEDDSLQATLSVANGGLVLEDATTVVATLDPGKDLGASAFGPLKFRPVDANGAAGDWQPLTHLVRLPTLTQLKCVKSPQKQCILTGSDLFLIDSIASDAAFTNSITVPEGYADQTLAVPHPDATKTLYVKLRDDPTAINTAQVVSSPAATAVENPSQASATVPSATPASGNH